MQKGYILTEQQVRRIDAALTEMERNGGRIEALKNKGLPAANVRMGVIREGLGADAIFKGNFYNSNMDEVTTGPQSMVNIICDEADLELDTVAIGKEFVAIKKGQYWRCLAIYPSVIASSHAPSSEDFSSEKPSSHAFSSEQPSSEALSSHETPSSHEIPSSEEPSSEVPSSGAPSSQETPSSNEQSSDGASSDAGSSDAGSSDAGSSGEASSDAGSSGAPSSNAPSSGASSSGASSADSSQESSNAQSSNAPSSGAPSSDAVSSDFGGWYCVRTALYTGYECVPENFEMYIWGCYEFLTGFPDWIDSCVNYDEMNKSGIAEVISGPHTYEYCMGICRMPV